MGSKNWDRVARQHQQESNRRRGDPDPRHPDDPDPLAPYYAAFELGSSSSGLSIPGPGLDDLTIRQRRRLAELLELEPTDLRAAYERGFRASTTTLELVARYGGHEPPEADRAFLRAVGVRAGAIAAGTATE